MYLQARDGDFSLKEGRARRVCMLVLQVKGDPGVANDLMVVMLGKGWRGRGEETA